MNRVIESTPMPLSPGAGPHAPFLGSFVVAVRRVVSEIGYRLNKTAPKDGSEPVQMVSYGSVDLTIAADLDDGDPGYYAVVRCSVTGADRTISGLVNGLGQEGEGGRVVTLMNVSATYSLIVGHEDAGSAAANRFKLPRGFGITIAPEMAAVFWYDPTSLRWRVM